MDRLEKLQELEAKLYTEMQTAGARELASLAKQYRETLLEIEQIEGGEQADDEIGEILSGRDGMSDSVRKNRA